MIASAAATHCASPPTDDLCTALIVGGDDAQVFMMLSLLRVDMSGLQLIVNPAARSRRADSNRN